MLRYYSYYSVGGYKDFLLGSKDDREEATYYLPLLPVLEERAENDAEAAKQVECLRKLPAIKQLSSNSTYGLPSPARTLFSHGGYKFIYKHLEDGCHAMALRNIADNGKDEHGRSVPFMFVIMGDSAEDIKALDVIATYIAANISTVEEMLPQFLYMDVEKNGLKFELAKFNSWLDDVLAKRTSTTLPTVNGGVEVHAKPDTVALLVLPQGISAETAITEQKITSHEFPCISETDILSKDNPEQLVKLALSLADELKEERKRNGTFRKGIVAAGISGLFVGALIAGCCHK